MIAVGVYLVLAAALGALAAAALDGTWWLWAGATVAVALIVLGFASEPPNGPPE